MARLIVCTLMLISLVAGHGVMTLPRTRNDYLSYNDPEINYNEGNPVPWPPTDAFVCRDHRASEQQNWLNIVAGQSLNVTWGNGHPGDCALYLTYDGDSPNVDKKWFKIVQWKGCDALANKIQTVTIPNYLPSTTHAVLRWEMYALHLRSAGTVEFYAACTDIRITGTGSTLPSPSFNIPGHMPVAVDAYRQLNQDFVTGPPVATIGGASYTEASTSTTPKTSTTTTTTRATSTATTTSTSATTSTSNAMTSTASTAANNCISLCQQGCGARPVVSCSCSPDFNVVCGADAAVSDASAFTFGMLSLILALYCNL